MNKLLKNGNEGIYLLMLTPYNDDFTIDYKTYEEYCEFQVNERPEHLFCNAGTSEMTLLSLRERSEIAKLCVKHKGDTTVVTTANLAPNFEENVEEIKTMESAGVDGLVFVLRDMGKDPDRLVDYIGRLRAKTDLPVFTYEFPGFPNHCTSGETYARLVKEAGISGIKDTTSTLEGIAEKIALRGDSVILQANMPWLHESYKLGARGVMATPTACGGIFFRRFHDAFMSGDEELATRRYNEITLLDNAIDSGFNRSAKYLVQLRGVKGFKDISRGDRFPLSSARRQSLRSFAEWAKENGLF